MGLGTILLIVLVLLLIGAIPSWPHSRNWGDGPSGGIGLVLLALLARAADASSRTRSPRRSVSRAATSSRSVAALTASRLRRRGEPRRVPRRPP